MSWKDSISAEEALCIEELKKRTLKDITPDLLEDETLFYRFSKARDFVIADAEAMLKKHIIWREQYKVGKILENYKPPEIKAQKIESPLEKTQISLCYVEHIQVLSKYNPLHFIGYDKDGSPILYFGFGNFDIKGAFNSTTTTQFCSFCIYTMEVFLEKLRAQTQKLGKPLTSFSSILNFEYLTFANATNKKMLETMLIFVKVLQDNYPEIVKYSYYINTSFYFSLFFNVVKYALSKALISKIRIFRPSDDWQGALLEKIDADVLPAFLGGSRTDPDGNPMCPSVIPPLCKIPNSFYLVNLEKKLSHSKDARKLTVTRLSKETWSCEVTEPGSYLEWEFETKKMDIGFAVLYKSTRDSNPSELLPKQMIDTCYEPEKGFIRCDKPGTYICVFDNSCSWIHTKELYFRIQVTPPRETDISLDSLFSNP